MVSSLYHVNCSSKKFSVVIMSRRPSAYVEDYLIDVQTGVLALLCMIEERKRRCGESRAFSVFKRDATSESLMQVDEMTKLRAVCYE